MTYSATITMMAFMMIILSSWVSMMTVNALPISNHHDPRSKVVKKVKDVLFHGIGTYYEVPGVGSCGQDDNDNEMVVAVNKPQMKNGVNPNANPECEKKVFIEGEQGKTAVARIVDTCPGCHSGSLDMSPKVFKAVCGNLKKGTCKIKWRFNDN